MGDQRAEDVADGRRRGELDLRPGAHRPGRSQARRGLSLLLLPIDQSGVEVRPIRTLTGHAEFCEFFFTDATASTDHVIGGVNNGWKTAMTLLGFERSSSAAAAAASARVELDRLAELIRQRGRANDPLIRQRFAWCWSRVSVLRYLALRAVTRQLDDAATGPESSILKLYVSTYQQRVTELAMDVMGAYAASRIVPTSPA